MKKGEKESERSPPKTGFQVVQSVLPLMSVVFCISLVTSCSGAAHPGAGPPGAAQAS